MQQCWPELVAASAVFRAPSGLVLPGWAPISAALGQMISLLKPLLPELAGHHCAAVCIYSVGEVLAGEANPSPFPILKLLWVDVLPLVHGPLNAVLMY